MKLRQIKLKQQQELEVHRQAELRQKQETEARQQAELKRKQEIEAQQQAELRQQRELEVQQQDVYKQAELKHQILIENNVEKKKYMQLYYNNKISLYMVPKKIIDKEFCLFAVKHNEKALMFVPPEIIDSDILTAAKNNSTKTNYVCSSVNDNKMVYYENEHALGITLVQNAYERYKDTDYFGVENKYDQPMWEEDRDDYEQCGYCSDYLI